MRRFLAMGSWRGRHFGRQRWRSLASEGNMEANSHGTPRAIAKAHFDGKQIVLDEPLDLAPGTPLIVAALTEETAEQRGEWSRLAAAGLARAGANRELTYGPRSGKPNRPLA